MDPAQNPTADNKNEAFESETVRALAALDSQFPTAPMDGIYSPPQLRYPTTPYAMGGGPKSCIGSINWYSHRSPVCNSVVCPGATCLVKILEKQGFEVGKMYGDNELYKRLLKGGSSIDKCPERLRGLFWMQDNVVAETLVTFQDNDWTSPKSAEMKIGQNWSHDITCYGAVLALATKSQTISLRISESGKWARIGGDAAFIYFPDAGEEIKDEAGNKVDFDPENDFLRYTFKDINNPAAGFKYQYRARRVAYLNDADELVKPPAYDQLVALVKAQVKEPGCMGDHCYCNLTWEQRMENQHVLATNQIFKIAPPEMQR